MNFPKFIERSSLWEFGCRLGGEKWINFSCPNLNNYTMDIHHKRFVRTVLSTSCNRRLRANVLKIRLNWLPRSECSAYMFQRPSQNILVLYHHKARIATPIRTTTSHPLTYWYRQPNNWHRREYFYIFTHACTCVHKYKPVNANIRE